MRNRGYAYVSIMLTTAAHGALYVVLGLHLRRLGYSVSEIGLIFSLLGIFQFLARFPAGLFYEPHRAPVMAALGVLAMAGGLLGLSLLTDRYAILGLVALFGAGFGFMSTIHLAVFVAALPEKTGTGGFVGWYMAAVAAGFTLGNFSGGWISDLAGLTGSMRIFMLYAIAASAATLLIRPRLSSEVRPNGPFRLTLLRELRSFGRPVLAAAVVAIYIGFVNEMMEALFPLYGADVGLSNTVIGSLKAIRSGSATLIRVASPAIVGLLRPGPLNHWNVGLLALATVSLVYVRDYGLLAVLLFIFGATRGLLRVTSTTLATQASKVEGLDGIVSMVYHVALDLGTLLGPLVGGALAGWFGIPSAFLISTIVLTLLYVLGVAATGKRRTNPG